MLGKEQFMTELKMKEMQVDYLQGYFIGRPCEKERFLQQYAFGNGQFSLK